MFNANIWFDGNIEVFGCVSGVGWSYKRWIQDVESYSMSMPKDMKEFNLSGFFHTYDFNVYSFYFKSG